MLIISDDPHNQTATLHSSLDGGATAWMLAEARGSLLQVQLTGLIK